ncbi:MAG TPA: GNAT family N-acetyltransferase, partial [Thermomicrobiales bacterium]|nr:GNAT family N-acetyltransferase [Thermomicrobiales bacterium]
VASDSFNVVCGARLTSTAADARVAAVAACFQRHGRPFSWWVGPDSEPSDLGARLTDHGLALTERSIGMAWALTDLPPLSLPPGVAIRPATTLADLTDFADVLAASGEPPDPVARDVYIRGAPLLLTANVPLRCYVAYLDGEPVGTSECVTVDGVAGLYNVATLPQARRRGVGTALTLAPLIAARAMGCWLATLQAATAGEGVYARLGFVAVAPFVEHKPNVAASA